MTRFGSLRASLAFVAASVALAACAGGFMQSSPSALPDAGTTGTASALRPATAQEKQVPRPSITSRDHVQCDRGAKCGGFVLQDAVSVDASGTFSASSRCDASIWDAPWYWAGTDFSLPIAAQVTLPQCARATSASQWRATHPFTQTSPTPTATPLPTPAPGTPTNLYVIRVDIGWFSLDAVAVAGPATLANGQLTFPRLTTQDAFQRDHLYAFFIAAFTGNNCPVPTATP